MRIKVLGSEISVSLLYRSRTVVIYGFSSVIQRNAASSVLIMDLMMCSSSSADEEPAGVDS